MMSFSRFERSLSSSYASLRASTLSMTSFTRRCTSFFSFSHSPRTDLSTAGPGKKNSFLNSFTVVGCERKLPFFSIISRIISMAMRPSTSGMPLMRRRAMPIISLSSTSFSRLWQFSKSSMPAPETMFIPVSPARIMPMPVSKPDW